MSPLSFRRPAVIAAETGIADEQACTAGREAAERRRSGRCPPASASAIVIRSVPAGGGPGEQVAAVDCKRVDPSVRRCDTDVRPARRCRPSGTSRRRGSRRTGSSRRRRIGWSHPGARRRGPSSRGSGSVTLFVLQPTRTVVDNARISQRPMSNLPLVFAVQDPGERGGLWGL